jgi:hypothetical protein
MPRPEYDPFSEDRRYMRAWCTWKDAIGDDLYHRLEMLYYFLQKEEDWHLYGWQRLVLTKKVGECAGGAIELIIRFARYGNEVYDPNFGDILVRFDTSVVKQIRMPLAELTIDKLHEYIDEAEKSVAEIRKADKIAQLELEKEQGLDDA